VFFRNQEEAFSVNFLPFIRLVFKIIIAASSLIKPNSIKIERDWTKNLFQIYYFAWRLSSQQRRVLWTDSETWRDCRSVWKCSNWSKWKLRPLHFPWKLNFAKPAKFDIETVCSGNPRAIEENVVQVFKIDISIATAFRKSYQLTKNSGRILHRISAEEFCFVHSLEYKIFNICTGSNSSKYFCSCSTRMIYKKEQWRI